MHFSFLFDFLEFSFHCFLFSKCLFSSFDVLLFLLIYNCFCSLIVHRLLFSECSCSLFFFSLFWFSLIFLSLLSLLCICIFFIGVFSVCRLFFFWCSLSYSSFFHSILVTSSVWSPSARMLRPGRSKSSCIVLNLHSCIAKLE